MSFDLAVVLSCPDCNSRTSATRDAFGILHVVIAHDPTCPTYRAFGGGAACPSDPA